MFAHFFTILARLGEYVTGGTVNVKVKGTGFFSIFPAKTFTSNLCPLLPSGCPVNKGLTTMTVTQEIPSYLPKV